MACSDDRACGRPRGRAGTRVGVDHPGYRRWTEPPERIEGFTPFERRSFGTTQAIDPSRLADLFATSSDVASLPPPNRDALLERIRTLASDYPSRLTLIGRSDVLLCFRA